MDCVFCAIIEKKLPASIIADHDDIIVIEDRAPKAPIHYLIIPKKHLVDINSLKTDHMHYVSKMFAMVQELSNRKEKTDFKLLINNGYGAGQRVFHLHMHFLAGSLDTKITP